jgi:hypothetical protein
MQQTEQHFTVNDEIQVLFEEILQDIREMKYQKGNSMPREVTSI